LLNIIKLYKSLIECKNLIKLLEKHFKDEHDFQSQTHDLFTEETKEAIEYLMYIIEDIFDIDNLLKKLSNLNSNSTYQYVKENVNKELDL
jgi:hypothetical protein